MKKLVIAIFCLYSLSVFASGKIMIQPNYFTDSRKIAPLIGLSIYEKFTKSAAFNSWMGMGDQVFVEQDPVVWYSIRNAVDFYKGPFTISPGVQSIYVDGSDEWQHRIFVRGAYQLW